MSSTIEPVDLQLRRAYIHERRRDSLAMVVPALALATVLAGLLGLVIFSARDVGGRPSLWIVIFGSPIVFMLTRRLLDAERQEAAGWLFCAMHMLLLTTVYVDFWQPASALPFFYGLFTVAGDKLIRLGAGFGLWLISSAMLLAGVATAGELSFATLVNLLLPMLLNLLLAAVSFLSTIDWQLALESVTEVQRRAQIRRDELFEVQEELSRANARLQQTNKALEQAREAALYERDLRTRFMNNVTHELRTPLNAVVNFAHILSSGVRGPLTGPQADYLERIERSGQHVLQVLNDLLDLAQIESGEFKLYREYMSLEEICESAMSHVRGLVWEKDIKLIRDYPEQWPMVYADRLRLTQTIINLLGNAAKYTEQGYIALRVRPDKSVVYIIVEDSGVGIEPQYHDLIFQEFRQVDEGAARKRAGTGLGLPITRHLVERHGGRIIVRSTPGKGSQFIIALPLAVQEQPAAAVVA